MQDLKLELLRAALPQVRVQGWGALDWNKLANSPSAELCFPRGTLDLALFHLAQGDESLQAALEGKVREKIANLIWQRLTYEDRELAQKTARFFAQPLNGAAGAKAMWQTADAIWQKVGQKIGLGDKGFSYYTKRASLGLIYSQALLFYLSKPGKSDEKVLHFIDREIDLLLKTMRFLNPPAAA